MTDPVAPDLVEPQLSVPKSVIVRDLGHSDYWPVFEAMQAFTQSRQEHTLDELWLVEHPPVFTQGLSGKPEHVLAPGDIPVIPVDRGGQVTYHGPGQVVIYVMLDVRRAHWGPRQLITRMEQAVLSLLGEYGIDAYARPDAPGVYVDNAKLASLGLRIRRGCSYHGLSLNVAMDLEPFQRINPCGYPGLRVTQVQDLGIKASLADVRESLLAALVASLEYTTIHRVEGLATFAEQETEHVRT